MSNVRECSRAGVYFKSSTTDSNYQSKLNRTYL